MKKSQHTSVKSLQLIAGDIHDFLSIQSVAAALPDRAYGQIFIAIEHPEQRQDFHHPRRMQITWILNSEDGAQSRLQQLREAVNGWLAEWQVDDEHPEYQLELWLGAGMNPSLTEQWRHFDLQFPVAE